MSPTAVNSGSQVQAAFFAAAPATGTVNQFFGILQGIKNLGPAPGGDNWAHYSFGWDPTTLDTYQVSVSYFWNQVASEFGWPQGAPQVTTATQSNVTLPISGGYVSTPVAPVVTPVTSFTPTGTITSNTNTAQQSLIGAITSAQQTTNSSTTPVSNALPPVGGSYFSLLGYFGIAEPQLGSLPIGEYTAMLIGAGALVLFMGSGHGR